MYGTFSIKHLLLFNLLKPLKSFLKAVDCHFLAIDMEFGISNHLVNNKQFNSYQKHQQTYLNV